MKKYTNTKLSLAISTAFLSLATSHPAIADSFTEALTSGTASADLRLRYESVEQDNAVEDASALTLRTRLGYKTGSFSGFSALVEMEDNRIVLGQGDYTVGPSGYNLGMYSVIADPEVTELDQGFIQYKGDSFSAKLGRQVITMDNHRFVGHVGWRQDRQTFDGLSAEFTPAENLSLKYAYISQRNRIFAEDADLDAKDHLINASYQTSYGKFIAYGYLLEVDNTTDNGLDTYGLSFTGSSKVSGSKLIYAAEFATQTSEAGGTEYDADYMLLEAGTVISGVTAKVAYEVLGSDQGAYGFSTPLATLHKFNGWSDQFLGTPAQGLVDLAFTLSGKLAGGAWTAVYHDFSADEASAATDTSAGVDDLGSEVNLSYAKKLAGNYTVGVKYAAYSAGDINIDADKLWLWVGASF